jgi:hypothetical protein
MERTTLQVETCEYTVLVDEIHAHDGVETYFQGTLLLRQPIHVSNADAVPLFVKSTCLQDE